MESDFQEGDILLTRYDTWPPWPVKFVRDTDSDTTREKENEHLIVDENGEVFVHVEFLVEETTKWVSVDAVCRYTRDVAELTRVRRNNVLFKDYKKALKQADELSITSTQLNSSTSDNFSSYASEATRDNNSSVPSNSSAASQPCRLRLSLRSPTPQVEAEAVEPTPLRLPLKSPAKRRRFVVSNECDPPSEVGFEEDDFFNSNVLKPPSTRSDAEEDAGAMEIEQQAIIIRR